MCVGKTFNIDAILTCSSNDGWYTLEQPIETVASFLPNCSASHLPIQFCSTKTTLSRFIRLIWVSILLLPCENTLMLLAKVIKLQLLTKGYVEKHNCVEYNTNRSREYGYWQYLTDGLSQGAFGLADG